MPRRYHRPPALKRRKSRRTGPSLPYEETAAPPDGAAPAEQASEESTDDEWEDGDEYEEEPPAVAVATETPRGSARAASQHIQRDYSYVRTELTRVLVLAGFLFLALIIVSVFR